MGEVVLITGATGRIGLNLIIRLLEKGFSVRAIVMPGDQKISKLADLDVEIIKADIRDYNNVLKSVYGVNYIVHLAALMPSSVSTMKLPEESFENRFLYYDINVNGTLNILEAARKIGKIQNLIFASTDAVYPVTLRKYIPVDENHPQNPVTPYALSKLLGEKLCFGYFTECGIPVSIARLAWTFAADEVLKLFELKFWQRIFPELREAIDQERISECKYVCILDKDGKPLKLHVADVRDIVSGLITMLENEKSIGEVFNLAGPSPFYFDEAAKTFSSKIGKEVEKIKLPGSSKFKPYEISITKARCYLGYKPNYDILKMINSAFDYREGKNIGVIPP